jgi:thiamine kinase-like enzyme
VIADGDELVFVDWECAGHHLRDWDLALLWTQLAPNARPLVEDAVRAPQDRWRAFLALVVFALARELRFLLAFGATAPSPALRLCRDELADAIARLAPAS